jgi:GNAT superfamily N-acetyltransferase
MQLGRLSYLILCWLQMRIVKYIYLSGEKGGCESDNKIIGFAIANLKDDSIWALFVLSEYEKMGIGKYLHQLMPDWYFTHSKKKVWLSTSPGTRVETFYIKKGWTKVGYLNTGEIKMEMTATVWLNKTSK